MSERFRTKNDNAKPNEKIKQTAKWQDIGKHKEKGERQQQTKNKEEKKETQNVPNERSIMEHHFFLETSHCFVLNIAFLEIKILLNVISNGENVNKKSGKM